MECSVRAICPELLNCGRLDTDGWPVDESRTSCSDEAACSSLADFASASIHPAWNGRPIDGRQLIGSCCRTVGSCSSGDRVSRCSSVE